MPKFSAQPVLIAGPGGAGKSTSLIAVQDGDIDLNNSRTLYLNCERGKQLPFPNQMKNVDIEDPTEILDCIRQATDNADKVDVVVIDTFTAALDTFYDMHVAPVKNGFAGWNQYSEFVKTCMGLSNRCPVPVVYLCDLTEVTENKQDSILPTFVPIKGGLSKLKLESFFNVVVHTTKLSSITLAEKKYPLTEEEKDMGFAHVFLTRPLESDPKSPIRKPLRFWRDKPIVSNNLGNLLQALTEFYAPSEV